MSKRTAMMVALVGLMAAGLWSASRPKTVAAGGRDPDFDRMQEIVRMFKAQDAERDDILARNGYDTSDPEFRAFIGRATPLQLEYRLLHAAHPEWGGKQ
jgi:hypothetical protein